MTFLFPTDFEARPFQKMHPDADVVICGVGMAATAATVAKLILDRRNDIDHITLAGIAGAYNIDTHPICSVVEVVSEQIEELPQQFSRIYKIEPRWALKRVSSNSVNRSNYSGSRSEIENMEGASAAAICEAFETPFTQIRAISNLVGDPFERWSIDGAIEALTDVLSDIYRQTL